MIELSPQQLQQKLAAGGITLIDVREAAEFAAERIDGAINMPLSTFDPHAVPSVGDIVFHCGVGKRSAMAIDQCRAAGVPRQTHLAGGLNAWKNAGLPTISD